MTRRDWWLGILVLVAALFAHSAINRYAWHVYTIPGQVPETQALVKIDKFTGAVALELVPPSDIEALYAQTR